MSCDDMRVTFPDSQRSCWATIFYKGLQN